MDSWTYQLTSLGILTLLLGVLVLGLTFAVKRGFNDPKKKTALNKALLKELLERFGLELPSELKEEESNVINSIKAP